MKPPSDAPDRSPEPFPPEPPEPFPPESQEDPDRPSGRGAAGVAPVAGSTTDSDTAPETDSGTDPGKDPGTDPDKDFGTGSGGDPGTDPDKDFGAGSGGDPGTDPAAAVPPRGRRLLLRAFLSKFLPLSPVGLVLGAYAYVTANAPLEALLVGAGMLGALAVASWAWARAETSHGEAREEFLSRLALSNEILNSIGDLVLVANEEGLITYASPSVRDRLGYEPDEVLGEGWWKLTRESEADRQQEKEAAALHARRMEVVEWGVPYDRRIRHRDGSYRWIRWRESPGPGHTIVGIGSDVTAQKIAEDARQRLAALIQHSSQFVGYARPDGQVRFINPGGLELLGLEPDADLSGYTLEALLEENERPRFAGEILPGILKGESWDGETRFRSMGAGGDGESIPVHGSLFPLLDEEGGKVTAIGATFMDLRAQKELEEGLLDALRKAEAAGRAKQEFLSNMSHEIRTPLNAIIGVADLLWESPLTSEQKSYVQMFRTAGESLLTLINDILDLAKVEEGRIELEELAFDLPDLVESTVEVFAGPAQEKDLEIGARIQPGVPSWVIGDPGRLRQVLSNLIGNAVKFTDAGEILVQVAPAPPSSAHSRPAPGRVPVLFSVSDTGVGIPEDRVSIIFDRFTQADASTTRRFGGTGLGLAISKRLVELMGGHIWVESEEGKGSTFHFRVEMLATEPPRHEIEETSRLAGLKALVVDDNATNRLILRETLQTWGVKVSEADRGAVALEILREAASSGAPYRLLLLDVQMPEMDGYQVAEQVRDDASFGRPRVVMLTSQGNPLGVDRMRELQLSASLLKPVRRAALLQALGRAVGGRRLPERPAAAPAAVATAEGGPGLRVLIADDSEDNRLLLRAYLKKTPHEAAFAENGKEAVELFRRDPAFDLILMDIQMPEMDGYAATRAIREWETSQGRRPVRIYALSAHAMAEEIRLSLEAGCDDHLTKPIKKQVLLDTLAHLAVELKGGVGASVSGSETAAPGSGPGGGGAAEGSAGSASEPDEGDTGMEAEGAIP